MLGITFVDVMHNQLPANFRIKSISNAVQVQQVFPKTSASQAGLKQGDYLFSINGANLTSRSVLFDTILSKTVGDVVELTIGRGQKVFKQKMALSPRPDDMQAFTKLLIGSDAKELQGKYYSNKQKSLKKLQGKVILLDFWATWCGPCLMTLPHLETLYRKYKDQGVVIIGVSSEPLKTLTQFQTSNKLSYPLFNDISRLSAQNYNAYAYPTLVYIDKSGIIQRIESGAHDIHHIESRLKELLGRQ